MCYITVCLMNHKDRELLHFTSKLLVSLLFDTVIRFDDGPKLPSSIARRYVHIFDYQSVIARHLS